MMGHKICFYEKIWKIFPKLLLLPLLSGPLSSRDNFSYFSMKHVVTLHYNRFGQMLLMMGHKICFYENNMDNYPKITGVTPSICSIELQR